MAGKSIDDVSVGAGYLKKAGVRTMVIRMGSSYEQSQLSTMAFTPDYILRANTLLELPGVREEAAGFLYQGP